MSLSWDLLTRAGSLQVNILRESEPCQSPWQAYLHMTGVQICSWGLDAASIPRPGSKSLPRGAFHWSPVFPNTHGSHFLLLAFVFSFLPLIKSPPVPQDQFQQFVLMTDPSRSLLTPGAPWPWGLAAQGSSAWFRVF